MNGSLIRKQSAHQHNSCQKWLSLEKTRVWKVLGVAKTQVGPACRKLEALLGVVSAGRRQTKGVEDESPGLGRA